MSKNAKGFYLLALLLVVLALPGCGKKSTNNTAVPDQNQNQNQTTNETVDSFNPSGEYTVNELLSMHKPLKCTWKQTLTEGGEVTNIIYINGQKFYQDVTMGDMGHAYAISDGEYLYSWNDFTDVASKMNIKEMQENSPSDTAATPEDNANTMEQARNFVCEKWSVDNSVFVPPANKEFKDITEEMGQAVQNLQNNSEQTKNQACGFCQKAPTQELIDECLKNAQCAE